MRQEFDIAMDDGTTLHVDADARDIRAWEAEYASSWFRTPVSFTTVAQVAYIAAKRTGALNGAYPSYEDFDAHCVDARSRLKDMNPIAGNPTRPDPTEGSSVRSGSGYARSPRPSKPKVPKSSPR